MTGMSLVRSTRFALFVLLGAFLAGRLVIVTKGVVFSSNDSATYAARPGSGSLISLFGHAPRLWGVPLFYALFGSDPARAYGQWALGTIAWGALAAVVFGLLRHPLARIAGAAAVLMIGLLPQVDSWDFAILSESLSISLGVLTLALLLHWVATNSRASLIGTIAVAVWWTFTRPDIRVFTVFLLLAMVLFAWRMPARRTASLVAAGVLLLTIGWTTAVFGTAERTYQASSPLGVDEGIMYQLRTQVFPDAPIKAVFVAKLGMPDCPGADAIAAQPVWRVEEFAAAVDACPALRAWVDQHRDTAMSEFARADPALYLRMTDDLMKLTLGSAHYASVPGVLPGRLGALIFPVDPGLLRLTVALLLGVVGVLVTRARRVDPVLTWGMVAVAAVCLVSAESNVVFGVGEFWRFGVQEAAGLRVAILLLLVVTADTLLMRRSTVEPGPVLASDSDVQEKETADADRGARGGGPGQG
jgi:hypothetical protein